MSRDFPKMQSERIESMYHEPVRRENTYSTYLHRGQSGMREEVVHRLRKNIREHQYIQMQACQHRSSMFQKKRYFVDFRCILGYGWRQRLSVCRGHVQDEDLE